MRIGTVQTDPLEVKPRPPTHTRALVTLGKFPASWTSALCAQRWAWCQGAPAMSTRQSGSSHCCFFFFEVTPNIEPEPSSKWNESFWNSEYRVAGQADAQAHKAMRLQPHRDFSGVPGLITTLPPEHSSLLPSAPACEGGPKELECTYKKLFALTGSNSSHLQSTLWCNTAIETLVPRLRRACEHVDLGAF